MSYGDMLKKISPRPKNSTTPQTKPLPGQIKNNAGGFFYAIDDWKRLERFLILGTESGTYYVQPLTLTKENTLLIQKLLEVDGIRVVDAIVEISASGRAPKNNPALFALALATAAPDPATRKAALKALPLVARTGTHLLMFTDFVSSLRGWGRGLRNGLSNWFTGMPIEKLCLQAIKYAQRDGWSLRDVLRLAHPKVDDPVYRVLIDWIAHPKDQEVIGAARQLFNLIDAKYRVQEAITPAIAANTIREFSLPREAVPTIYLNDVKVWDALLADMPMTAIIRNLGKMTSIGLFKPYGTAQPTIVDRLTNAQFLKQAKIHPLQILMALRTYARGQGELGSLKWEPIPAILEALNKAFDLCFEQVIPTGKRILVGIDVSGSMYGTPCSGSPLMNSLEAAAAVGMFFARTERSLHTMAFDTQIHELIIQKTHRFETILSIFSKWGQGGTDLSLPITYAFQHKLELDAFVVITDNETWAGNQHPIEALNRYRAHINPGAKLIVLACAANQGCITPPYDPLSLGIAGFDAAAPQIALDFITDTI